MTIPSVYVSFPRVLIAGQLDEELSQNLLAVMVEETWEGLYHCELTFNNFGASGRQFDYLFFGRDKLDFGADITLEMGPPDQSEAQVFKGRITGLEAEYQTSSPPTITALAEDALQDMRMTRRTRSFEDMSDQDVIQQIAGDHSLMPQLDMSGPTHKVLAQVNLSDLAFVRECARRVDAEIWVEGTTLYASSRKDRAAETVTLEYGVSLMAFSVRADLTHQCSELTVSGWDVAAKEAIAETAGADAISAELNNGDTSGSAVLDSSFEARPQTIVHRVPLTTEEARVMAEASYRARARRFVTGTGLADGNPALRVGKAVDLSGLGGLFDGAYYITRVCHRFDGASGFRSEFDVERPGIGEE
ncbi:MAG: hypothetical protein CL610_02705 [Anaerolineaceae bacterium]|nr:hypothetical protein [Anaerolineaceae bacterium]